MTRGRFAAPRRPGAACRQLLVGLLLAAAWLGAAPSASAGWVEDRDGKTVIHLTLFDLPDPARVDPATRAEAAAVRAFREAFPTLFAERYRARYEADPARYGRHNWSQVEIELERFSGIQVPGVEVDLLAIAGGMAPDVLYVNFRKSDNYIQNDFLYPLDLPEDGYAAALSADELKARIHDKFWPVIRRPGPKGQTHLWAMPSGGALGKVLFFRKDLFQAHGLAWPDARWTWDDLLRAAQVLTDPRTGTYGMYLTRSRHEAAYWMTYLWSAGGEAMTQDPATGAWRCVFDTPEAATALDFYLRLSSEKWVDGDGEVRRGYSARDVAYAYDKWNRGQIGMMVDYVAEHVFAQIDPEVTGMAPVPLGPTGERGAELNGRMMGLFSRIEHPAVRDAAWEYIRFYDSEPAQREKVRVLVEGGLGPFLHPKLLRRFGYPEIERLAPPGWAETFDLALATGRPEPYGPNSNVVYDLMTEPIRQAEYLAMNDALPEDPAARRAVLQGLLQVACARANEKMIGLVPPEARRVRRGLAGLMLAGMAVAFGLMVRRLARAFAPAASASAGASSRRMRWAWLLLLPALLSILVWRYLPLLRGAGMAFFDYRLLGGSTWVGLDHFGDALFDRLWWQSVWNAMRYSALVLLLTFLPPIFLAIFLQEAPRGKAFFRLLYYLPAVVAGIVTALMWKQFYEPSEHGLLNAMLRHVPAWGYLLAGTAPVALGALFAWRLSAGGRRGLAALAMLAGLAAGAALAGPAASILWAADESWMQALRRLPSRLALTRREAVNWLNNPETAMLACVLPMVWAGIGPGCLIYLAALKGIPDEYYEAASIDGAGFIDKICFIVFPSLKALIVIQFVGAFIGSWYGATGNILVLTGGAGNTEVAGLHIWYKAFTYLQFGPATAMAWMLGVLLIGFTVQQLRMLARVEFRAAGSLGTSRPPP